MTTDANNDWISADQFAHFIKVHHFDLDAELIHAVALAKEPIPSPRWSNGKPLWQRPDALRWVHSLHRVRREHMSRDEQT